MLIPNRGDKQYTDVEKFEKYELTYCIAYEMAIRNDEVIEAIYSFYNNYRNYDIYDCFVLSTDDFKKCYNDAQKLMSFYINPLSLYLDYHLFTNINKDIKELKEYDNKTNSNFLTHRLKRILYTPIQDYYHEEIDPLKKIVIYKQTPLYTEFISHLREDEEEMRIHHNSITPNYSRPLTLSFNDIKERNIVLNLALPTSELVDFIEKVKSEYDKNQSIIKNVHQLLNKDLNPISTKLPNIQNRYSDMFFCYDCYKLGLKTSLIVTKINNYRLDKGNFQSIKETTVKRYIAHGKKYIDEQNYKHLVT